MNCEHAANLLLDELYDELDERSRGALADHLSTCADCRAMKAKLARGREAAAMLPTVEPPDSLEARILATLPPESEEALPGVAPPAATDDVATEGAEAKVIALSSVASTSTRPQSRARRIFSAAGNWAMRPQTAMAAVFLLMVGTSTLALRMKHKNSEAAMSVTEQGTPIAASANLEEEEKPEFAGGGTAHGVALARRGAVANGAPAADLAAPAQLAEQPLSNAAAPAGAAKAAPQSDGFGPDDSTRKADTDKAKSSATAGEGEFGNAMSAYNARNFSEAIRRFDALAAHGDKQAALWAARSVRAANGCSTALTRFDHLASTAFGTPAGYDATMEAGNCYRDLGYLEAASSRYQRLLNVPTHADAARAALETVRQIASRRAEEMKGHGDSVQAGLAGAGGGSAPGKAAAPAAKPASAEKKAADRADPMPPAPAPAAPPPAASSFKQ